MKLSVCTFKQLKDAGVSVDDLFSCQKSAHEKREVTKENWTQTTKAFKTSESGAVSRIALSKKEDFAGQVFAFDKAMEKASGLWGAFEWKVPKFLLDNAALLFPAKSEPTQA